MRHWMVELQQTLRNTDRGGVREPRTLCLWDTITYIFVGIS